MPPEKLSEQEYLAQQAESAKRAMAGVWDQMKARLGQGVAPQVWAKEYPWITVGAAAVAGFVAAAALVPSKEQQALKKLARIERALNPPPPREDHANGDAKEGGGSTLGSILREAIKVARPILMNMMTAGLAAGGAAAGAGAEAHHEQAEETQHDYGPGPEPGPQ